MRRAGALVQPTPTATPAANVVDIIARLLEGRADADDILVAAVDQLGLHASALPGPAVHDATAFDASNFDDLAAAFAQSLPRESRRGARKIRRDSSARLHRVLSNTFLFLYD